MERAFLLFLAVAVHLAGVSIGTARAGSSITYADLSADGGATLASPGEIVRFYVNGSGCRIPELDSPPSINGSVIDFSLVFSSVCFATPPGFTWTGDLGSIPQGTYTINHYRQATNASTPASLGPRTLVASRMLRVLPRPSTAGDMNPGAPDPTFGDQGAAHVPFPGFFYAPVRVASQRSGNVLAASAVPYNFAVTRVLRTGAIDGTFAKSGTLSFDSSSMMTRGFAVGPNDEFLLAGGRYDLADSQIKLTIQRYTPDGVLANEIRLSQAVLSASAPIDINPRALDVAWLPDGRFAVAGLAGIGVAYPFCSGQWFIARFTPQGSLDPTFGQNGLHVGPTKACIFRLVATSDGGFLGVGTDSDVVDATFLVKIDAGGKRDSTFGHDGVVAGSFARVAPRLQSDGKIVVGGADFSLLRFHANGTLDSSFGSNGVVANPTGIPLLLQDFLLGPNILLAGARVVTRGAPGGPSTVTLQPVLVRYDINGALDKSFGNGGVAIVDSLTRSNPSGAQGPAELMALTSLANGKALLVAPTASIGWPNGSMMAYRFAADPKEVTLIEYYHAAFDHYFVTAMQAEIDGLDGGTPAGWARTGQQFNAYRLGTAGTSATCRFFSTAFGPKSSHFYTSMPDECTGVKASTNWLFEGEVFGVGKSDAAGNCPAGYAALYRSYNNGHGGAPNHRYTTSTDVRQAMIQLGWIPEGAGPGVVACVPAAQ